MSQSLSLALSNLTLSLSTAQPLISNFLSYSHPDRACKSLGVPCRGNAATNVNSEFHRPPGYPDMSMKRINMKIVYIVPHDYNACASIESRDKINRARNSLFHGMHYAPVQLTILSFFATCLAHVRLEWQSTRKIGALLPHMCTLCVSTLPTMRRL